MKELEQLDSLSQSLSIQDWYDRNRDWRSIVKDVADGARANRIDNDMGKSGFSMDHRSGWQRMLADITNNAVGIVFATSVSRLTRQSSTYEQLLSLAADHGTLLCIGKGIIDPSNGLWRNHK